MPTYHARGVTVRLGTCPLADTIHSDIAWQRGDVAKAQCEMAENQLLRSELLPEESIPFSGDERSLELNWLGNAPFLQVQAIRLSPQHLDERRKLEKLGLATHSTMLASTSPSAATRVSSRLRNPAPVNTLTTTGLQDNDEQPKALVLHVKLSNQTFRSGMVQALTQLKVEVFFNGQLSACTLIPFHEIRCGLKNRHQVFAGIRTRVLAERPWLLLPPGKAADGITRDDTHVPLTTVQRWQQINQAIQHEAYERSIESHGKASPSTNFLQALATMEMPSQVHNMHTSSGRLFGVIDVVISAGTGRKLTHDTSYLETPQRLAVPSDMLLENGEAPGNEPVPDSFPVPDEDHQNLSSAHPEMINEMPPDINGPGYHGQPSDAAESQAICDDSKPRTKAFMKASLCFVGRKFGNPASAARSRRNSAVSSPEDSSSAPTKPADVITAAEGSASGHDQGSPSSIPVNRLVITGKDGTVIVDHRWAVTQYVGSEATTTTAEERFETSATDPVDGTTTGSTTVHDSSPNKPRKKKRTRDEVRFSPVDNPPLNRDCVIAYAETSSTDANKPILRQVRSQRVGVFDEDHVVFAARLFVAGD